MLVIHSTTSLPPVMSIHNVIFATGYITFYISHENAKKADKLTNYIRIIITDMHNL